MSIFRADKKFERFEDVTPEILRQENVKLLLCDLDNTLTERMSKEPAEHLGAWIKACQKAGTEIVVISNNMSKKRVQRFCHPFKLHCVWWAKKPLSIHLTKARERLNMPTRNTAMLGDKWSTDVLAAKFAGIKAWKVEHRKGMLKDEQKELKKEFLHGKKA